MNQLVLVGLASPRDLIINHHYTQRWPSGKSKVYTYEDAVVVFSIPANKNLDAWMGCRVWEFSRLWAPDGHRANLLTQAIASAVNRFRGLDLADVLISYADPNAGHTGGVYRAASWTALGRSEEGRVWRGPNGELIARRAFHSGSKHLNKAQIEALGFREERLPGKLRFARALNRAGKRALNAKRAALG